MPLAFRFRLFERRNLLVSQIMLPDICKLRPRTSENVLFEKNPQQTMIIQLDPKRNYGV